MITMGSLERFSEAEPRSRMRCVEPAVPELVVMDTPVVRPWRMLATLVMGAVSVRAATSRVATDAAWARRSWRPAVPVTISSSRATADSESWKLTVVVCPAMTCTSCVEVR